MGLISSTRRVSLAFSDLARSELHLARVEIRAASADAKKNTIRAVVFGTIALLSVLSFIAFLIAAIGKLLHDNYWLSSLIVTFLFSAGGGGIAYLAFRRLAQEGELAHDLSLPETRETIRRNALRSVKMLKR